MFERVDGYTVLVGENRGHNRALVIILSIVLNTLHNMAIDMILYYTHTTEAKVIMESLETPSIGESLRRIFFTIRNYKLQIINYKGCVAVKTLLKGKCIDFSSRVQKKDNLISVRMAYLSLPYDKPNLPNRQLYAHVAIATRAVMTYERLSFSTEKVNHCRSWSFSIVLLYSRCERSAVFNAVSAVNYLSPFSCISLG